MLVSNFAVAWRTAHTSYTEDTTYKLQITNLHDVEIRFTLEFHLTLPANESTPVAYFTNVLRADGLWMSFVRKPTVVVGRGDIAIGSKSSVTVGLGKSVRDDREVTGFVVLRVPPARTSGSFVPGPQANGPVSVLLHARREDRRPSRSVGISDSQGVIPYHTGIGDNYSSESIPIASGRAENEITPEGRWLFGVDDVRKFGAVLASGHLDPKDYRGAELLPDDERIPALLDLLDAISESDEEERAALNGLLARLGVRLQLRTER